MQPKEKREGEKGCPRSPPPSSAQTLAPKSPRKPREISRGEEKREERKRREERGRGLYITKPKP